jgi:flagellar biosynthesis/type III secretory pathway M-ring protein FliF/YscJ
MEQLKKLLLSLTAMQRVTILFCALAMAAGVVWFSRWQQDAGLRPLYTSLAPEDANAMIQKLREG